MESPWVSTLDFHIICLLLLRYMYITSVKGVLDSFWVPDDINNYDKTWLFTLLQKNILLHFLEIDSLNRNNWQNHSCVSCIDYSNDLQRTPVF